MPLEFTHLDGHAVHRQRAREILARHPEVKKLLGRNPRSALWVVGLVAAQWLAAYLLRDLSWLWIFVAAYLFGAFVNHALYVLIHECTHNLVFRSPRLNAVLQLFTNLPILFPAAASFRKYHLIHHRFQGDPELDADLATPFEAKLIGNSFWGKAFWELNFWAFQAMRVSRLKRIPLVDGWYIANFAIQIAFIAGVWALLGPRALVYMFLASIFAIGLHPLGARWIQEHFLVKAPQETYSYYGPLNVLAFNVGYHNEHHDFPYIPGSRLARLRKLAPEFYDTLHSHGSWTKTLWDFVTSASLGGYSRVKRRRGA